MQSTAGDNELRRRHAAFALFSAVLFGISAPAAKLLLQTITPQLLAGLLYIGSGLGLSVLWLARRHNKAQAPLGRSALPWLGGAMSMRITRTFIIGTGISRRITCRRSAS